MTGFFLAGLCLAASSILLRMLAAWCRPVKFTELTRHPICQSSRDPDNARSIAAYELRRDALGLGTARNVKECDA